MRGYQRISLSLIINWRKFSVVSKGSALSHSDLFNVGFDFFFKFMKKRLIA